MVCIFSCNRFELSICVDGTLSLKTLVSTILFWPSEKTPSSPGFIDIPTLKSFLGNPKEGGGKHYLLAVPDWQAFAERHGDKFCYDDTKKKKPILRLRVAPMNARYSGGKLHSSKYELGGCVG